MYIKWELLLQKYSIHIHTPRTETSVRHAQLVHKIFINKSQLLLLLPVTYDD